MGTVNDQTRGDRRRAMRVPVRGRIVLHGEAGPLHGTVENLSRSGALVAVAAVPDGELLELELRLEDASGWVRARTVRVDGARRGVRLAVRFDRVAPELEATIDATIAAALAAARRRPILVIDDRAERRAKVIDHLARRGMTPLAPRTPLEAIDVLARAQLHVDVCLLAPGFGVPSTELATLLADSFPWVATTEITDDVDHTVDWAVAAWARSPVARIAAIG